VYLQIKSLIISAELFMLINNISSAKYNIERALYKIESYKCYEWKSQCQEILDMIDRAIKSSIELDFIFLYANPLIDDFNNTNPFIYPTTRF
jgi:hypothetical protein